MDVTDVASVRAGVAVAVDGLGGPIDIWSTTPARTASPSFSTRRGALGLVLGVNLRGVIAVTHAVLPSMHERGSGVIVNVASEAGRVGSRAR
jgi:2-hydroxycyclohexanecarboxyl-CoA dehydrogenase